MPSTPILGITQVSTSQNGKETTINDAILALENATNATLVVSLAAGNKTLTATEATRNFIFKCTGAPAAQELLFPIAVNGNTFNRIFAVRNESGFGLTVKFASGAGTSVVIPNGQSRLINAADGINMSVAAEPATVVNFLSLTDTPAAYTGSAGKVLAVNVAENALEFITAASFPSLAGNAGKYLVVNPTSNGVQWVAPTFPDAFLELNDTPANYTGAALKLVRVNAAGTALEFIDQPESELVNYVSASRWRIRVIEGGVWPEPDPEDPDPVTVTSQIGFAEVALLNLDGVSLIGGGVASASNFETGNEPFQAFDDNASSGWLTDDTYIGDVWIEYAFATPQQVRSVRLTSITLGSFYAPMRFVIEYFDGTTWVNVGDRTAQPWQDATPQTFKVNGAAFESLLEAPVDGKPYNRKDGGWVEAAAGGGSSLPALTGNENKVLAVNPDASDVEWIVPPAGYTAEEARDDIAAALVAGSNITITPNDEDNTIIIAATGGGGVSEGTGVARTKASAAITIDGTTPTVVSGHNVESVVRTAQGRYRVTFTTPLPDTNFGVSALCVFGQFNDDWTAVAGIDRHVGSGFATTHIDLIFAAANSTSTAAGGIFDPVSFSFEVYDASVVARDGTVGFMGARRHSSLVTATTTGTWAIPPLPLTAFDTSGFVTGTGSFTIPAGVSRVRLKATIQESSTNPLEDNQWTFFKNGTMLSIADGGVAAEFATGEAYNNGGFTFTSGMIDVVVGDVLNLRHYLSASAEFVCALEIEAISTLAVDSVSAPVVSHPYPVPFGFATTPTANEPLLVHVLCEAVTFPANFAGSRASIGANPSVTQTIDLLKNEVSVGTISITTGGVVSFTSVGGAAVSFAPGDRLTAVWSAVAGTTIINSAFTLLGQRD